MNKQGYKSVKQAQRLIDRERELIEQRRWKRMGFVDGSIEPKRGVGGGTGSF
jgi:hypothetical protein